MPALSDPTTWREPYSVSAYLSVVAPTPVFKCLVNQATFSYPASSFTYDGVSLGTTAALRQGMLAVVGSTDGASDRGQIILKGWTGSVLSFGLFSRGDEPGTLNLGDNAFVTVYDVRVPSAKIPYINPTSGAIAKWGTTAWSAAAAYPPVANTGGDVAGFVDSTNNVMTVQFFGSTSFATRQGASISTYAWDIPTGGTITVGTASDDDITVEFDPGSYYVRLTVTDSNGATAYKDTFVIAHTRSGVDAPVLIGSNITSHVIKADGQELTVNVRDELPESTYLDGFPAILWYEEQYGNTEGSLAGRTGREHVKGTFWHAANSDTMRATENGEITETTLKFVDIAGALKAIVCFPQVLQYNNSPSTWAHMPYLNIDRYVHYVLQHHSNALQIADFSWSGTGNTYVCKELASGSTQSLWDQAGLYLPGMGYMLTVSTGGQILIKADPLQLDVADRTSTVMETWTEDDLESLDYDYSRVPKLHWYRAGAITASATNPQPFFAVSPGSVPGSGVQLQELYQQIIAVKEDILVRAKEAYARANNKFGQLRAACVHGGDAGIEPAFGEWLKLSIATEYLAQRGLTIPTDTRFLVSEVSVSYDVSNDGVLNIKRSYSLERETFGLGAQYFVPPSGNYDITSPPQIVFNEEVEVTGSGTGVLAVFTQDGSLWRTSNFFDVEPTWTEYALGIGTLVDFTADPFVEGAGWLATTGAIYRIVNILTGTPTTTLRYDWVAAGFAAIAAFTGSDFWGVQFEASITEQNNVLGFINFTGAGGASTDTMYSVNTTTDATMGAGAWGVGGSFTTIYTPDSAATPVGIARSNRTIARSRMSRRTGASAAFITVLDPDTAISSTTTISTGTTHAYCLHEPFAGNVGGNRLYYSYFDSGSSTRGIRMLGASGTGFTNVTPVNSAAENCYAFGKNAITTCLRDRNYIACIGIDDNDDAALFVSANAGIAWTERTTPVDRYTFYTSVLVGNNPNILLLYGYDGQVGFSEDNGVTILEKGVGGTSRVIGLVEG